MSQLDDYDNLTTKATDEWREAEKWRGEDEVKYQYHRNRSLELSARANKIAEELRSAAER